jgi:hypothetical protein
LSSHRKPVTQAKVGNVGSGWNGVPGWIVILAADEGVSGFAASRKFLA